MEKSDDIVFTEPVTRPNRGDELWESDAVWLYRDRPIQLYPSTSGHDTPTEHASPRISKARLATIVDDCERLMNEPGTELILRSPTEGLMILRKIRLGWLVACARPDASQAKVAGELSRFSDTVVQKFESDQGDDESFREESTELMKAGRRDQALSWASIADDLNERIGDASGKFKMFGVKEWRLVAPTLPLTFDLRKGFVAHSDEPLRRPDELEIATAYREWVERLGRSLGDLPEAFASEPKWMLSNTKTVKKGA
jgi:hypothetical protein